MTDIQRFFAPGPWVTRDLKECVLASDYDALAAEVAALRSRLALWEQVWTALNDMGAELGDANKPLAVTASWALLRTRAENAERALEEADERHGRYVKAVGELAGMAARRAEAEALSPAGSRA